MASNFLCPLVKGCANAVRPERLRLTGPVISFVGQTNCPTETYALLIFVVGDSPRYRLTSMDSRVYPWVNLRSAYCTSVPNLIAFFVSVGLICDVSIFEDFDYAWCQFIDLCFCDSFPLVELKPSHVSPRLKTRFPVSVRPEVRFGAVEVGLCLRGPEPGLCNLSSTMDDSSSCWK